METWADASEVAVLPVPKTSFHLPTFSPSYVGLLDGCKSVIMDNGKSAPPSDGITPSSAKAGAQQEKQSLATGPPTSDATAAKKQSEIQFKAAHGLLVAFLFLLM